MTDILTPGLRRRLEGVEGRYEELERKVSEPETTSDRNRIREVGQELSSLVPIVDTIRSLRDVEKRLGEARQLSEVDDTEMRDLALQEVADLTAKAGDLTTRLRSQLVPRDPLDAKNVIVEIRAGEGGEEAALFAADLYRMYARYAERHRWKTEILSQSQSEKGGFKEIIFKISGRGAYSKMKFESGVHRVQRVPATEAQGRIHTSTATVAVLPEAEETDLVINEDDLKIDVYRAGGKGGHTCQDERSQLKNKAKAMDVLRSRLLAREAEERQARESLARNAQIGRGERSEKMRTYNFPQDRLTDRRLGHNLSNLDRRMDGDIDDLVEALSEEDEADRLSRLEEDGD